MNNIINKIYVINLKHRTDRWKNMQKSFKGTGLELTRYNAVNGKKLSEDKINKYTTKFCDKFCSPSIIGCGLSHSNLWRHIINNNEDNVLILEDDSYPIDDFNETLKKYWKSVPDDWDMIYFGCFGSCDASIIEKYATYIYSGKKDKVVHKNGVVQANIISPAFPLGLHAYMLSNKGASKLINSGKFDKIDYHIDNTISTYIIGRKDFNAYAFIPSLIKTNMSSQYSNNQLMSHPIFSTISENMMVSENHTLDALGCLVLLHIRKIGFDITFLNLSLFIISFIVGFAVPTKIDAYLTAIISYYISEIIFVNTSKAKVLILELLIIYLLLMIGSNLR